MDRKKLVQLHNPVLNRVNLCSPLTVGNGNLAFTADVSGLQSLYNEYKEVPLCTMSQWGWHTQPVKGGKERYTLEDLVMTRYDFVGREVMYPKKKFEGNEEVYDWLRHNPHRLHLGRIGFVYEKKEVNSSMFSEIKQELDLYEGILHSQYKFLGEPTGVQTVCSSYGDDTLGFDIKSEMLKKELEVCIDFPYGSEKISGALWDKNEKHITEVLEEKAGYITLKRTLDCDMYFVIIQTSGKIKTDLDNHKIYISTKTSNLVFNIHFSKRQVVKQWNTYMEVFCKAKTAWKKFWEEGGIMRLNKSKDPRAFELERRVILSQYLMAINSSGSTPPQETGLICNSWYGKMHLEMYLWHCAWLPLWGHADMLERSLEWYKTHLREAKENAKKNGYKGARWPKMIGEEGVDCPSPVAPLLVWQQPHVIYMLEMCYRQNPSEELVQKYWEIIEETASFMVDFVVWNKMTQKYDICAPVIPVQECHKETDTHNPAFEIEYFRATLNIACEWAIRLGRTPDYLWKDVAENMAEMTVSDNVYLAHEKCMSTFTEFNRDHPSMLTYGLLNGDRINKKIMKNTLNKVLECWDLRTMWGWDFAVMAMTAVRLEEPDLAIDIILKDTMKNCYLTNGNNMQTSRKDLPLYLPGNGSLLLAVAVMTAGYDGCEVSTPGFPKDGKWVVEYENIQKII